MTAAGRGRHTVSVLAVLGLAALAGQLAARPALAVARQWQQLRWPMNIGLQPPQPDGRWTAAEATLSVDTAAPALRVRWHAGDTAAARYRADVAFYVDGQLVERSPALPGRERETVLPLPPVAGIKRISIRVTPPFVPAEHLGGPDRRSLGAFLHSVTPVAVAAAPAAPAP